MFRLFRPAEIHDPDSLLRDIAADAARATLLCLGAHTATMDAAELRGYVRAKALRAVRAQLSQSTQKSISRFAFTPSDRAALLERTVYLVTSEVSVQPVAIIPGPHVRLRMAA